MIVENKFIMLKLVKFIFCDQTFFFFLESMHFVILPGKGAEISIFLFTEYEF